MHGARADGSVAYRRKLSCGKVLGLLASEPPCTAAMEACASAHYWGREIWRSSRSEAGSAGLGEALRQAKQERHGRRGGDHGGGAASDHALRGGQVGRSAGALSTAAENLTL